MSTLLSAPPNLEAVPPFELDASLNEEYLQAGVQEYWVIDRFSRTMTVFSSVVGQSAEQTVSEDGKYATPLLPGFELPLKRLLLKADKWKRKK